MAATLDVADILLSASAPQTLTDALCIVTSLGRVGDVVALLADGRADPAAFDSYALQMAACHRHMDVVAALLADGRADPAAKHSAVLRFACSEGHADVVRVLLADGRADPAARGCRALRLAAMRGCMVVVNTLLADGRVDRVAAVLGYCKYANKDFGRCFRHHARWLRRRSWLRAGAGAFAAAV
jgi:hypothetical protein